MSAQITTLAQQSTQRPSPMPQAAEVALSRMVSGLEREGLSYLIPGRLAPTDEQRQFLTKRAKQIDSSLTPAGADFVRKECGILLNAMAVQGGSELSMRGRIEVYVSDLSDLPAFAVSAACAAYRRGQVGEGHWAPAPGELRRQALKEIEGIQQERFRIRQVLDARVVGEPDPEKRASVMAMVERLKNELSMARPVNEIKPDKPVMTPDPRTSDERLADLAREYGAKPVRMSAEALAKYGVKPADEAWPGPESADERDLREAI